MDFTPLLHETAISLIEESYADDWQSDKINVGTDSETNGLLYGLDNLPSTSNQSPNDHSKLTHTKHVKKKTKSSLQFCDYCEFSSQSSYNLKRHMRRIHLNIYSFLCDTCGQHFKDPDTMNQHTVQVHFSIENQPNFVCSHCEKTFKRRYDRERHEKMHNKNQAFACPYCASMFTSSSNCQRHIKQRCELRPINS